MKLSNRILSYQYSPIRKLSPVSDKVEESGVIVYHLNIGQPDIKTPIEAIEAIRAYDKDIICYGDSAGHLKLRKSLVDYYKKYDVEVKPEEIVITTGGSEALLFIFQTLCDEGSETIIPEPYYTNVSTFAKMAQTELVPISSSLEKNFSLPGWKELEKKITDKTRAILLCNPNNPTGYVYSKEELKGILEFCKAHKLFIIVDEVYREFCYDSEKFISILSFKGYEDICVCVDSFSKRFSMCGARVGALVSKNPEIISNVMKLAQARLCPPDIEQIAANAALQAPRSYIENVKKEYQKRRDFILEALNKIPGVKCNCPKGAFYLVAQLPVEDAEDFSLFLLRDFKYKNQTVMLAPAAGFYATEGMGKNQVRIAYVLNINDLKNAMDCLERGLKAYKEK
ncbi:MAG: pyridoxal phosphate-dependent aminotransferase [Sphaerochaetaceae bacterium]|nr:pyridoxal phosphate-dependent aminotransferase [Sphaerochaetaceae bacterium]